MQLVYSTLGKLPLKKVTLDDDLDYASDGENLMQGQNNSVLTRIRDEAPGLFVVK